MNRSIESTLCHGWRRKRIYASKERFSRAREAIYVLRLALGRLGKLGLDACTAYKANRTDH